MNVGDKSIPAYNFIQPVQIFFPALRGAALQCVPNENSRLTIVSYRKNAIFIDNITIYFYFCLSVSEYKRGSAKSVDYNQNLYFLYRSLGLKD